MVVEIYVYLILVSNYFYVNEGHLITRSPTDPETSARLSVKNLLRRTYSLKQSNVCIFSWLIIKVKIVDFSKFCAMNHKLTSQ